MEYLELNNTVHGYLSARNIFTHQRIGVKISDYGIAQTVNDRPSLCKYTELVFITTINLIYIPVV